MEDLINVTKVKNGKEKLSSQSSQNLLQSIDEIERTVEIEIGKGNLNDYLEIYGDIEDRL